MDSLNFIFFNFLNFLNLYLLIYLFSLFLFSLLTIQWLRFNYFPHVTERIDSLMVGKSQSEEPTEEPTVAAVDRISQLPNETLCHILSFLPIKQAFTTTILSKSWHPICYSLTVLSFDDETVLDHDTFNHFCRFIDTLMLSDKQQSKLKTFSLKCRFWFDDNNRRSFDAWLEAAKRRGVEEFHIFLNNITLNSNIFISETLVVLKLQNLEVEDENLLVDLPSLKTLHLKSVSFEYQNDIKKILKACPNLEDLHTSYPRYIRRCEKNDNEAGEFGSLFLSKLVKADIGSTDVPFNVIYNVEFLRIIKVEPSLQTNIQEIFKDIPVFGNLIHIELWFYGFFHGWDGVVQLLQHCPKLQILYMRKWNDSLSKDWEFPFFDLECVSSHLRFMRHAPCIKEVLWQSPSLIGSSVTSMVQQRVVPVLQPVEGFSEIIC